MDVKNTEEMSVEQRQRQQKADDINSGYEMQTGEPLPDWLRFKPDDEVVTEALEQDKMQTDKLFAAMLKTVVGKIKASGNLGSKVQQEAGEDIKQ